MKVNRITTVLSDVNDLYFESLSDDGELCAVFKDGEDNLYQVLVKGKRSYKLSDEDLLIDYWAVKTKSTGWSFCIEETKWIEDVHVKNKGLNHFVISSWDLCLEILAESIVVKKIMVD